MEDKDLDKLFKDGLENGLVFHQAESQWNAVSNRIQKNRYSRKWLVIWAIAGVGSLILFFIYLDFVKPSENATHVAEGTSPKTEFEDVNLIADTSVVSSSKDAVLSDDISTKENYTTVQHSIEAPSKLHSKADSMISAANHSEKIDIPSSEQKNQYIDTTENLEEKGFYDDFSYDNYASHTYSSDRTEDKKSYQYSNDNSYQQENKSSKTLDYNTSLSEDVDSLMYDDEPFYLPSANNLKPFILARSVIDFRPKTVPPIPIAQLSKIKYLSIFAGPQITNYTLKPSEGIGFSFGASMKLRQRWSFELMFSNLNISQIVNSDYDLYNIEIPTGNYDPFDLDKVDIDYSGVNVDISVAWQLIKTRKFGLEPKIGVQSTYILGGNSRYTLVSPYQQQLVDEAIPSKFLFFNDFLVGGNIIIPCSTKFGIKASYQYMIPINNQFYVWQGRQRMALMLAYYF